MLTRVLSYSVPATTRARGTQYQLAGRVVEITGAEWMVHAVVRGQDRYRVEVVRERDAFRASCECPYFWDRGEVCKHIWAVVLEADRRGLLRGDGSRMPPYLAPDEALLDEDPDAWQARRPAGPPEWQQILTRVEQRLQAQNQQLPQNRYARGELVYIVDAAQTLTGRGTVLNLMYRQRKKTGEWAKPKPAPITLAEIDRLPSPEDRELLALLLGAADPYSSQPAPYYGASASPGRATFVLVASVANRILQAMAQTGRLHLSNSAAGPDPLPTAWDDGPPWQFELRIDTSAEGITLQGALTRDSITMPLADAVLLLADGLLFTRSTVARFDARGAFSWIPELRRAGAPTFPPESSGSLVEALARSGISPERLPADMRYEIRSVTPQPRVTLARTEGRSGYAPRAMLSAHVQFDYDGTIIGDQPASSVFDASRRRLIQRDGAAERRALERLGELGFRHAWDYGSSKGSLGIAAEHFPRAVRTLVDEGWRVEAEGQLFRPARDLQMRVASGVDWFELHGRVDFDEGASAGLPELLAAIRRGEGSVILDDGTRGLVPEAWLRRYAGIARFGEPAGDHVRFRSSQAALLDALLAAQPAVAVDEAFARAREALRSFDRITPLNAPGSFTGALREYQRDALGWFAFLRQFGFGGCLADDMGLGKTVMVIALLEARRRELKGRQRLPSLAVVPRSLVFNWAEETQRFAPKLRVLDYTGAGRSVAQIGGHDLVLVTYGTLRRDVTRLKDVPFDYVILDEAQAAKNPSTAAAKAVRLLQARHRLALSGTPIENHLGELWSLFEFLNPGFLGSAATFQAVSAARNRVDPDELPIIAKAVRPFILRRTKQQVAPELPERSEQTIHCELEGVQRRLYDQLRAHYRSSLLARIARTGINRSKIQVLEALLRLRQAACHPALVDHGRVADPSAKLDVLLPRLTEVVEEGHKALVFSQFTSFLALLRPRLADAGIRHEYLDGSTRDRGAHVERFQQDHACPVFLISLKAGGLGLNLTAAEYVFLLDPWWNPAVEAQAIDRAHRIGQTRHVFAYRLIAKDTVEEKVAELQQSKRELADAILSADAGLLRDLKAEDVAWLLS